MSAEIRIKQRKLRRSHVAQQPRKREWMLARELDQIEWRRVVGTEETTAWSLAPLLVFASNVERQVAGEKTELQLLQARFHLRSSGS